MAILPSVGKWLGGFGLGTSVDPHFAVHGDYITELALGNVPGRSFLSSLGNRESMGTTVTGEDVWPGNELSNTPSAPGSHTTIPIPDSAGEQMSAIAESAEDGVAGTGALTIDIHYLDSSGVEQETVLTMNGTTEVDLIPSDVRFIQFMHVATVGSNEVAVSNIRIYKKSDNARVYCMIKAGGNMSLVPNKMVPVGKTLILRGWHAEEAQGKRCAFRIRSTNHNGDAYPGVFLFKDSCYLKQQASGELILHDLVPALAIVKVTAWPVATGAEGSCHWWGELVDNA